MWLIFIILGCICLALLDWYRNWEWYNIPLGLRLYVEMSNTQCLLNHHINQHKEIKTFEDTLKDYVFRNQMKMHLHILRNCIADGKEFVYGDSK